MAREECSKFSERITHPPCNDLPYRSPSSPFNGLSGVETLLPETLPLPLLLDLSLFVHLAYDLPFTLSHSVAQWQERPRELDLHL